MYILAKGSSVIGMRVAETDHHNNCLFNMAISLGHHYYYLLCGMTGSCAIPGDDNLVANTNDLRELLLKLPAPPCARDA